MTYFDPTPVIKSSQGTVTIAAAQNFFFKSISFVFSNLRTIIMQFITELSALKFVFYFSSFYRK